MSKAILNKYWFLFIYQIKKTTTYRLDMFLQQIAASIDTIIIMLIWSFNNTSGNYNIFAYLLIGRAFQRLTRITIGQDLGQKIKNGSISQDLLLPGNLNIRWLIQSVGERVISNISAVIVILILSLFFKGSLILPVSFLAGFLFFLYIFVSIIQNYFWQIIMASSSFWTADNFGIIYLNIQIIMILAGVAIPFDRFGKIGEILEYNPFATMFYNPMKIYLDPTLSLQTQFLFFGLGVFWTTVFGVLANYVFKIGLKKNEAIGL
jgi:ABC-2 type transport system permease protein